jgi:UDPglucose 6-dehydrogenase
MVELPAHAGDGPIEVVRDPYEAATGAACVVVCTEWPQFLDLDLVRLRSVMAQPSIVDGRNLLDAEVLARAGFSYHPVGRASVELA